MQSLAPQFLATAGAVSRGGVSSWLWACGAGDQAGLNPTSPGKTLGHQLSPQPWGPPGRIPPPGVLPGGCLTAVAPCAASGYPGNRHPKVLDAGHPAGWCPGSVELWGGGGGVVLGDRGHHQPHAGSPGGTRPPRTPLVGPSRRLRVRDEQANPILIPDYVPREPLTKAGCGVAIGAGGPGMDSPPIWEFKGERQASPLETCWGAQSLLAGLGARRAAGLAQIPRMGGSEQPEEVEMPPSAAPGWRGLIAAIPCLAPARETEAQSSPASIGGGGGQGAPSTSGDGKIPGARRWQLVAFKATEASLGRAVPGRVQWHGSNGLSIAEGSFPSAGRCSGREGKDEKQDKGGTGHR